MFFREIFRKCIDQPKLFSSFPIIIFSHFNKFVFAKGSYRSKNIGQSNDNQGQLKHFGGHKQANISRVLTPRLTTPQQIKEWVFVNRMRSGIVSEVGSILANARLPRRKVGFPYIRMKVRFLRTGTDFKSFLWGISALFAPSPAASQSSDLPVMVPLRQYSHRYTITFTCLCAKWRIQLRA